MTRTHASEASRLTAAVLAPLSVAIALAASVPGARAQAQPYFVVHEAGAAGGPGTIGGVGATARFTAPAGIATDGKGTLLVADAGSSTIRKVTTGGVVSLLAGRPGLPGSHDETGSSAAFDTPLGVAVDATGTVWVADTGNHTIRRVTGSGVVTTFAGGTDHPGATDATGTAARFFSPSAVVVDASGTLYVADTGNHTIRKVTSAGVVTTLAGRAGEAGSADGAGVAARFASPAGLVLDANGALWVADTGNHLIRRVSPEGTVSTFAGRAGEPGPADGGPGVATFAWPTGITLASDGYLYVTDTPSHVLRRVAPDGSVVTVAGVADEAGSRDGTHAGARFFSPRGIAFDASGLLYIADSRNHTIRASTLDGCVATLAGLAPQRGAVDATRGQARFASPMGIAIDAGGALLVADAGNHVIRRVGADGAVTTLAGTAGAAGSADGVGALARFSSPVGVVLDAAGNLLVSDSGNHTLRLVTPAGVVSTWAGAAGVAGWADGARASARFNHPAGLARDAAGNVYVADAWNHVIRRISSAGTVTTMAGTPGASGSADGSGAGASFAYPSAVAVTPAGDVFVADAGNATIRRVTQAGAVSTVAGKPGVTGWSDGTGAAARFRAPTALAAEATGNVLVGDGGRLRRVAAAGEVVSVAGAGVPLGTDDGTATRARLGEIGGIAVGQGGVLHLTDTTHAAIRRATPTATIVPVVATVSPVVGGMAGGTLVTITGANFTATDLAIRIGGKPLEQVVFIDSTTVVGRTPSGRLGKSDLELTTKYGRSTLAGAFDYTRYAAHLAEGATIGDFAVELALLNPATTTASATLSFLKRDGTTSTLSTTVGAGRRLTLWPAQVTGMKAAEFSTSVESTLPLIVDRTMTWGAEGFGSHAETSVAAPALTWYLAEGATHSGFDLFYLLQNPGAADAEVEVTYLLPGGVAPLVETYQVEARSRFNIWVDLIPALANTDVSAVLRSTNGVPIIVERAMYQSGHGRRFDAGHDSAGVTVPATEWFLAEGATGPYFDLFVLIANPGDTEADIEAQYLLDDGRALSKRYRVAAQSRFNIWVDLEELPAGSGEYPLDDVAVSTVIRSLNEVPVVVERAMWWPGPWWQWHEAHNSPGSVETGTKWGLAAGEVSSDARSVDTFILIANTSAFAGEATVTLYFEAAPPVTRRYALRPHSRTNAWVNVDFPEAAGKRFGAVVESVVPWGQAEAAQIVVERAMYSNAGGVEWAAGTNVRAAKLQ